VRTSDKTGFIVKPLAGALFAGCGSRIRRRRGFDHDIDAAIEAGLRISHGAVHAAGFVGLDTTYYITNVMFDEFKERRFAFSVTAESGW